MTSVALTSPGQCSCPRSPLFPAQRLLQVLQRPPSPNSGRSLARPLCLAPESLLNSPPGHCSPSGSQDSLPGSLLHRSVRPSEVPGLPQDARHSEHPSSFGSHTGRRADHLHSRQPPPLPGLRWGQVWHHPLGFQHLDSEAPCALWRALPAGGKLFILSNGRGLRTVLQAWAGPQALQASLAPRKCPGRKTFVSSLSQPTQRLVFAVAKPLHL